MKKILFVFVILLAVSACIKKYSQPKELSCIEFPPKCTQSLWEGLPIDTTVEYGRINGWYYQIFNVKEVNSEKNEYSLAFDDKNFAYLTYRDGVDRVLKFLRVDEHVFVRKNEISSNNFSHLGMLNFFEDNVLFCSNKFDLNENIVNNYRDKPYNQDGKTRIPLSEMIGQTRIFMSRFDNAKFEKISLFESSKDLTSFNFESHPSLSPEGRILFFTSDRDGGEGGTDIWFSVLENGNWGSPKWSKPINLGDKINTLCDELSPFVSNDGRYLYFSSAGHKSVGGYDIFRSDIDEQFYETYDLKFISNPENLKSPINTKWDELFPSSPLDTDSVLYYSSNQSYGGINNFDIYLLKKRYLFDVEVGSNRTDELVSSEVEVDYELEDEMELLDLEVPTLEVEGMVINTDTDEPVVNAEIVVKKLKDKQIIGRLNTNLKGEYKLLVKKTFDVEILVEEDNTLYDNFILTVMQMDTLKKIERNLHISTQLTLRINFPYDDSSNPYDMVLDSSGRATNKKWQNEMDNLAKNIIRSKDKVVMIKLVGHTDFVGSNTYNKDLGQKRVDFVAKELILRAVPKELLSVRSAGKDEPIARKSNEAVEDYHKRLRRVSVEKVMK